MIYSKTSLGNRSFERLFHFEITSHFFQKLVSELHSLKLIIFLKKIYIPIKYPTASKKKNQSTKVSKYINDIF